MVAATTLQNCTWKWDERREKAAVLLAVDEETDEAIAKACKVSRQALADWKRAAEFQARIAEHVEAFRQRVFRTGFADKARRVRALDTVATALLAQMQRAEYQTVLKVTDDGEHIYGFDDRRLKVFLDYLDDIAEEMGERQARGASATAVAVVKVYTDARMDNPLEADWHDAPAPRSSADR
jgi:hypothetical protein